MKILLNLIFIVVMLCSLSCDTGNNTNDDDSSDDDQNDDDNDNNDDDDTDDDDDDNDDNDSTDIVDEYGITWKFISGGEYQMGCSPNDEMCYYDEKPAHKVILSAFRMSETEITQEQYKNVIGENPTYIDCWNCGVWNVSWSDAKYLCEQVGGRLPTEAEWEYAARGGTTTRYFCGDDPFCLNDYAWFSWNSSELKPVKAKKPNQYGLYDMLGNLEEYVSDYYQENYYQDSPESNPVGPSSGSDKVVRGGFYGDEAHYLRVSERSYIEEEWSGDELLTIRCAMDAE